MRLPIVLQVLAMSLLVFGRAYSAEIQEKQSQDMLAIHNKCVSEGILAGTDQYSDCLKHPDKYIDHKNSAKKHSDEFLDKKHNNAFEDEEKAHKMFKKHSKEFVEEMKSEGSGSGIYDRRNKPSQNQGDITKTFPIK